jgi:hypothetical protein
VLLVATEHYDLGKQALDLTIDALPRVEKVVGKYPYNFLYVEVSRDLPKHILGTSYDEFITLRNDSVDVETVVHEVAHSTLYGIFPLWFEEGFAHFMEYYTAGRLEHGGRDFTLELREIRRDNKLDIRSRPATPIDEIADRARGFLFIKGLYDLKGDESFSRLMRSLRTRTVVAQDLIRAIAADGTPEEQKATAALLCKQVVGTTRTYCVPGQ